MNTPPPQNRYFVLNKSIINGPYYTFLTNKERTLKNMICSLLEGLSYQRIAKGYEMNEKDGCRTTKKEVITTSHKRCKKTQ